MDRVAAYAGHVAGYVADAGLANAQAYRLLAASVTGQANVLAYRDGFLVAAVGAGLCLLLVALTRPGTPSAF